MKLSQEALAKLVDRTMGQSFISNLENGLRSDTPYFPELAEIFGVSAYWLKTGKGERLSAKLNSEEQTIIDGYRLLEPAAKEMWLIVANSKIAEEKARANAA